MRALSLLLALATLPVLAQTTPPPTTPRNPTPKQATAIKDSTAAHRAAGYKGPRVVKDGKKLGREFIQDSKPAPAHQIAPTRQ